MTARVHPPRPLACALAVLVVGALSVARGVHAQERIALDVAGPLREHLEIELRARQMVPMPAEAVQQAVALIRADERGVAVRTLLGEWRLDVDTAEPSSSAIVIASRLEDALADLRTLGGGMLPDPPEIRAFEPFGAVESGAFVVVAPYDLQAYGRGQVGLEWREGVRLGLVLDLLGYHWSSGAALQSGVGLHLGPEAGLRVTVDDLALHAEIHALGGLARLMRPSFGSMQQQQLAGLFGGSIGAGVRVADWLELGLRLRADAMLDERGETFALLRGGIYAELH